MENPLHNGRWQIHQHELRNKVMEAQGLTPKKDRWPDAGLERRTYDFGHGPIDLYVLPKNPPLGRSRGGMLHRAQVVCPHCSVHVAAGRFQQHLGTVKCQENRKSWEGKE